MGFGPDLATLFLSLNDSAMTTYSASGLLLLTYCTRIRPPKLQPASELNHAQSSFLYTYLFFARQFTVLKMSQL